MQSQIRPPQMFESGLFGVGFGERELWQPVSVACYWALRRGVLVAISRRVS